MRLASLSFAAVVVALCGAGCPTHIVDDTPDAGAVADAGFTSCVDDTQCGTGHCLQGVCSSSQCSAKADCAADQVCVNGQCTAPPASCTSTTDCPGTLVCDGFSHHCFDPSNPSGGEGEGSSSGGEGEGSSSGGEGEGSSGPSIDLSHYAIENRENNPVQQAVELPDGTSLFAGHSLVIGRSASKSDFENFWGTLPSTAFYKNGNGFPVVNGGEKFTLVDPNGNVVDGPTFAGQSGKDYQRTSNAPASSTQAWSTQSGDPANATPGATSLSSGAGLKITEWSDASGSGSFDFEFIEISYLP